MVSGQQEVVPVKLIIGILTVSTTYMDTVLPELVSKFGPLDYRSEPIPFTVTDYYSQEMGFPLKRIFVSHEKLINPADLPDIKRLTTKVEDMCREDSNRRINLDPGYMDYHKIVLASFKYGGYKLYLGHGVYGDMTLHYAKGNFQAFNWSFPDFKLNLYNEIFLKIRQFYKKGSKKYGQSKIHKLGSGA